MLKIYMYLRTSYSAFDTRREREREREREGSVCWGFSMSSVLDKERERRIVWMNT